MLQGYLTRKTHINWLKRLVSIYMLVHINWEK